MSKNTLQSLFAVVGVSLLSACTFQPMHGSTGAVSDTSLSNVGVQEVDTRVGQQVRNHLLFLLKGGQDYSQDLYEARLLVSSSTRQTSVQPGVRGTTAGYVVVTASYALINAQTGKRVAGGSRNGFASFDRTTQNFANERAERDAENRAGKAVAEQLRLAIASDLTRLPAQ